MLLKRDYLNLNYITLIDIFWGGNYVNGKKTNHSFDDLVVGPDEILTEQPAL